jgi:outer membrane protein TolC
MSVLRKKDGSVKTLTLFLSLLLFFGTTRLAFAQQSARGASTVENNRPTESVLLCRPELVHTSQIPEIQSPEPNQTDQALPINLATALCLSQARPLVISAAQTSVMQAAAQLQGAKALWLPDLHLGADYSHHDGAIQNTDGSVDFVSFGSLYSGGGATLNLGVTDAIFSPLAARQELCARQLDVQTARNAALLTVAQCYFDVQESRGRLAGILDSAAKAEELVKQVESLSIALVPGIEVDRAQALLADLNHQAISARTTWRVSSARLNRTLRLNPSSVIIPQEPPHLQVTLISSQYCVDDLICCGLLNRPELDSQRAAVQATLELLRRERIRPLLPSVILEGRGPNGTLTNGYFGGGQGGDLNTWGGQAEFDVGLVWTLRNLGLGNRALIRGREADRESALIEFFNIQDRVAEEVVQAQAQVEGAREGIREAEREVNKACITFTGTLKGLVQVRGAGGFLQIVNRPQEAVAALQQLTRAYDQYFISVNSYNRAQFLLYYAIGYPSRIIVCDRPTGDVQTVDTRRPPDLNQFDRMSSRPRTSTQR